MRAQHATTSTLSKLAGWLEKEGWEELPASSAVLNYCDRLWRKQIGQVCINLYNYSAFQENGRHSNKVGSSFAVELTAQSRDGYCTRYEKYGIRERELRNVLNNQIKSLIRAWRASNKKQLKVVEIAPKLLKAQ